MSALSAAKPVIQLEFEQMVMKMSHTAEVSVSSSLNELQMSAFKAGWELVGKHYATLERGTAPKEHGGPQ